MKLDRRTWLKSAAVAGLAGTSCLTLTPRSAQAGKREPRWEQAIEKGARWLASRQSSLGNWTYPSYGTTPATALAGTALICTGSTTTQGPYARFIRRATDFLMTKVRSNGLIGDPNDARYTYGHGFSMLFLSQVLGEEEDAERRSELIEVLNKSVEFSALAQADSGGWGYVSAKDVPNFDEGSTTITQVQGLRGCRNAGIAVPGEVIEKAKEYIYRCQNADGGISYSSKRLGTSRPAITAAALASLYNAGAYDDNKHVPEMQVYCKKQLYHLGDSARSFGHWHYTYLYYSQVVYREGESDWEPFRDKLYDRLVGQQAADGAWSGNIDPTYVTSCNLIMLLLDKAYLPIYQR